MPPRRGYQPIVGWVSSSSQASGSVNPSIRSRVGSSTASQRLVPSLSSAVIRQRAGAAFHSPVMPIRLRRHGMPHSVRGTLTSPWSSAVPKNQTPGCPCAVT
ncbi:hypothetical protein Val02_18350 [Virgisporangium aliadipatigenens]|uniref:Uncharacterized protein n=1 Tax=Virgisporangium aliadipatigenens TaxID=741659 RepID=A0A8J4DNY7_9ACTN|nr:hypothetical protein Val02_18350 [Virgisporangium aliadipatigenens]